MSKHTIFYFFASLLAYSAVQAAPSNKQYNDNPPYNFHGEIDNTDIYAIPLDSSEEEQDEELDEFEEESKEYNATHPQK